MSAFDRLIDIFGNLHLGSFGRASKARITVDFDADDLDGIALDAAASPVGVSERSVIKLGDYIFGQDTTKAGVKNFGLLNANGVMVAQLADGNGASKAQQSLFNFNMPLIIAPTGSIADGGVNTSGTANPLTYLKTFTWFPLGALYGTGTTPASAVDSPAGWYYAVWTTTTSCQVYANTWDGASTPAIPTTLTSLPAALTGGIHKGPGAFTGPTTEALYISLPVIAANPTSFYALELKTAQTNNANAKSMKVRFSALAGTALATITQTSLLETDAFVEYAVQGVADKQRVSGYVVGATANARITNALTAETTSAAFSFALTATKADATDVTVIEGLLLTRVG